MARKSSRSFSDSFVIATVPITHPIRRYATSAHNIIIDVFISLIYKIFFTFPNLFMGRKKLNIMRYIGKFATSGDVGTAVEEKSLLRPYVAYVENGDYVDWNTYEHDYSKDYLTFEALSDGRIFLAPGFFSGSSSSGKLISPDTEVRYPSSVSQQMDAYLHDWGFSIGITQYLNSARYLYSVNNGFWNIIQTRGVAEPSTAITSANTIDVKRGDIVRIKGTSALFSCVMEENGGGTFLSKYKVLGLTHTFYFSGDVNIKGNIASFFFGDNFAGNPIPLGVNSCFGSNYRFFGFNSLFRGQTHIINAKDLIISPAQEKNPNVYRFSHINMFAGCTRLLTAPQLPRSSVLTQSYQGMFSGCTSLEIAPEIVAHSMSANSCYQMFAGCTSLTQAPELLATTLVKNCYSNMFSGCTNLNSVKALFTTTPTTAYTNNWLAGVSATGTFYKNPSATWHQSITKGPSTVPEGWTIENAQ